MKNKITPNRTQLLISGAHTTPTSSQRYNTDNYVVFTYLTQLRYPTLTLWPNATYS